eukprot:GEMP01034761.1.p2 GENE.GEMP01034761.1~~GEMP01034761.1.p2  ORF type:complete len:112 (-),score=4.60 GEMP01034761.1:515-850(-)
MHMAGSAILSDSDFNKAENEKHISHSYSRTFLLSGGNFVVGVDFLIRMWPQTFFAVAVGFADEGRFIDFLAEFGCKRFCCRGTGYAVGGGGLRFFRKSRQTFSDFAATGVQ